LDAGLITALIQDAGLTEFGGVPTYTALAIGPDIDTKIDELTKDLPLL
jgi:PTH2 family peptidyl-tRNA hydrolase